MGVAAAVGVEVVETGQHSKQQQNVVNQWHSIEKRSNVDSAVAIESLMLKRLLTNEAASATPIHYGIDDAEMVDAQQAKMAHSHSVYMIWVPSHAERLICLFNGKNRENNKILELGFFNSKFRNKICWFNSPISKNTDVLLLFLKSKQINN